MCCSNKGPRGGCWSGDQPHFANHCLSVGFLGTIDILHQIIICCMELACALVGGLVASLASTYSQGWEVSGSHKVHEINCSGPAKETASGTQHSTNLPQADFYIDYFVQPRDAVVNIQMIFSSQRILFPALDANSSITRCEHQTYLGVLSNMPHWQKSPWTQLQMDCSK